MRLMFKSKIHRARLTGAEPDYEGSIAIDSELLAAANILEYEMVHVWNVSNGERLETYAIKARAGSGEVALNGAAALRGKPGDIVIIATFAPTEESRARRHAPIVVHVDERNRVRELRIACSG